MAASTQGSLLLHKQLKDLMKNPVDGFSAGLVDDSNIFEWSVTIIGPPDTLYDGGYFNAIMSFPANYPNSPPSVRFISEMWHPNVYPDGRVCISILHAPGEDPNGYELASERWTPVHTSCVWYEASYTTPMHHNNKIIKSNARQRQIGCSSCSPMQGSLWSTKAPTRVIAFGWTALLGGILTMDNLRRHKVIVVNACSMCLANEESVDHLLLNCPLAQCIWRSILSWFHSCGPLSNSIPSLFDSWRLGVGSIRGRVMWELSFLAAIWSLWKERNLRCFEGKSSDATKIVDNVKHLVQRNIDKLHYSQLG